MENWMFYVAIGFFAGVLVFIYNRLVALRQTRKNAFADIDVQLKMRHDLVPNLSKIVQRYADHENSVFKEVTEARAQAAAAKSIEEKGQAEGFLEGSLMKLLAVAEDYPELKADKNFLHFQEELANIERTVASARRFFNNATSEFNTAIEQFPAIIIAKAFSMKEEAFFNVGDEARNKLDTPPSF